MTIATASIKKKLGASFGVLGLGLLAISGTSLVADSSARASAHEMEAASEFQSDVTMAKFWAADFNGWQTAYAFDAVRGVAGAADDSGDNRKLFLESSKAFEDDIKHMRTFEMAEDYKTQIDKVEAAYEEFMKIDGEVAANYRQGTPAATKAATELVLG